MSWNFRPPGETLFLERYPEFARRPATGGGVRYVGYFERTFTADDLPDIPDAFHLEIEVSPEHPRVVPRVFEVAGRIPRGYHKLVGNAFCLSSRLRLAIAVHRTPDLCAFLRAVRGPVSLPLRPPREVRHRALAPTCRTRRQGLLKDYIKTVRGAESGGRHCVPRTALRAQARGEQASLSLRVAGGGVSVAATTFSLRSCARFDREAGIEPKPAPCAPTFSWLRAKAHEARRPTAPPGRPSLCRSRTNGEPRSP